MTVSDDYLIQQALTALNQNNFKTARNWLNRAVKANPMHPMGHFQLAFLDLTDNNPVSAEAHLAVVTQSTPHFAEAWLRRGHVLMLLNRFQEAAHCFEQASNLTPNDPRVWEGVAEAHKKALSSFAKLIQARRELVRINPTHIENWLRLGYAYRGGDLNEEATLAYEAVLKIDGNDLRARWSLMQNQAISCFDTPESELAFAQQWSAQMSWFESIDLQNHDRSKVGLALLTATDFTMGYQSGSLRAERQRHARLVSRMAHYAWQPPSNICRIKNKKRRIGIVSSFFRNHSVMKVAYGLILGLKHPDFEVFIYHLDSKQDALTTELKNWVHSYKNGEHAPDVWLSAICADSPDVLLYLDIGMQPLSQVLPAYRLAPVQCAFWGHPLTSGYDTIDWFISAQDIEPDQADAFYTERLHKLSGLGTCYPVPKLTELVPTSNKKTVDFLLAQHVLKIDCKHDALLAQIALRVPNARFHIFPHLRTHIADALKQRIGNHFIRHGLNPDSFLNVEKQRPAQDFFRFAQSCDINLDTIGWSGGITSFELLAYNLPMVTYEGAYFRGRQSSALLRRMNLPELVASSLESYVDIAVSLAKDAEKRRDIGHHIDMNKHTIYDTEDSVTDFISFISQVAQR
jgi:protein O-GlcNAc transferase